MFVGNRYTNPATPQIYTDIFSKEVKSALKSFHQATAVGV
jgi:hypothetical protein